jgi:hypothetical protein
MAHWITLPTETIHHIDDPDLDRPDLGIQVQAPDLAGVEAAIMAAVASDFPDAHVDSARVAGDQPAGHATALGVWTAPGGRLSHERRRVMRAALGRPIDRAPGQTIAVCLREPFIRRLAGTTWDELPRRLDGLDGGVQLTGLRVELEPPDTVVTLVQGYGERPLPGRPFTLRVADTFKVESGAIRCTPERSVDPGTLPDDVLSDLPLGGSRAGARDRSGVGGAAVERYVPVAIPAGGGAERPVAYTGDLVVRPDGLYAGGVIGDAPRRER